MIKVAVIGGSWLLQALSDNYEVCNVKGADLVIIEDGQTDIPDASELVNKTVVATAAIQKVNQVYPTVPLNSTFARAVASYFHTTNLSPPREPYAGDKSDTPSSSQGHSNIGVATLYSSTDETRLKAYNHCLTALSQQNAQAASIRSVDTEPSPKYNKSKHMNHTISEFDSDKLILLDSDIVLHPTFIDQIQTLWLDNVDWIRLDGRILDLSKSDTDSLTAEKALWKQCINKTPTKDHAILPAGILVITKQLYETVGGMHEGYAGWGCEDWDFLYKLEEMSKGQVEVKIPPAYHMFHTPQPQEEHSNNVKLKNHRLQSPVSRRIAMDRIYYEKAYMRSSS